MPEQEEQQKKGPDGTGDARGHGENAPNGEGTCAGAGPFHVGLAVRDLFAQEFFYRTVLGFELLYRYTSRNTPGLRTVMLRRGALELELLAREEGAHSPFHLALGAEDVETAWEALGASARERGEAPRSTGDGFRECALRDPEGNRVEIFARERPFRYRPLRGVIFDLDGTLVDSEENYCDADCRMLEEHGVPFTPEMKLKFVGYSNEAMMRELRGRYGLTAEVEELVARKNELYLELARKNTPVFPEMRRLLDVLVARGIPRAVATGSSRSVVREVLAFTGLEKYFDVVLSSDEVGRSKPAPDVFLAASARLGVAPDEAVVFEDSVYGVEAAVRGGFRCVAIPAYPDQLPLNPLYRMADVLVEGGMGDFSAEEVLAWMGRQGEAETGQK